MILQRQCTQVTVDEDDAFPSKSAYMVTTDDGPYLCWTLSYLHDRLKQIGETRKFNKWCSWMKKTVENSELVTPGFRSLIHLRGQVQLGAGTLDESVASTESVLTYFLFVMTTARKRTEISDEMELWIRKMTNRVCEEKAQNSLAASCDLDLGVRSLTVYPGPGLVQGLQTAMIARHRTAFEAWKSLWNSMKDAQLLSVEFDPNETVKLPLSDVIMFALKANRFRRRKEGKSAWDILSPSGDMLVRLQRAMVEFLGQGLFDYVLTGRYQDLHDVSKAAPSRRVSSGNVTNMPVENIWEVLSHAQTSGTSARQALEVMKSKLCGAAGCHANTADAWVRRRQIIYDSRMTSAFFGACHFNLVADCSKHSGQEVLCSVMFSHQSETAGFPSLQIILPCDTLLAPGEIDFSTIVEQLAKAGLLGICIQTVLIVVVLKPF